MRSDRENRRRPNTCNGIVGQRAVQGRCFRAKENQCRNPGKGRELARAAIVGYQQGCADEQGKQVAYRSGVACQVHAIGMLAMRENLLRQGFVFLAARSPRSHNLHPAARRTTACNTPPATPVSARFRHPDRSAPNAGLALRENRHAIFRRPGAILRPGNPGWAEPQPSSSERPWLPGAQSRIRSPPPAPAVAATNAW